MADCDHRNASLLPEMSSEEEGQEYLSTSATCLEVSRPLCFEEKIQYFQQLLQTQKEARRLGPLASLKPY